MIRIAFYVISVSLVFSNYIFAGEAVAPNGEFTQAELEAADDMPSACSGMPVFPNGETAEQVQRRLHPGQQDPKKERVWAQIKEDSRRSHLPKSVTAAGGQKLFGESAKWRRQIDGPANLRDAPGGKTIGSFPDGFVVLLEGQKGDWFYIRGYYDRPCETGWTHKKNLVPYVEHPTPTHNDED